MTAKVFKLTTAGTTNLTKIGDQGGDIKGVSFVCTAAYAIFVKFYWFVPTASAAAPTVGTTVPDMTVLVPALGTTTGQTIQSWPDGITKSGQLWMAVTKLAADSDTTVVVAGDGILSVIYEG